MTGCGGGEWAGVCEWVWVAMGGRSLPSHPRYPSSSSPAPRTKSAPRRSPPPRPLPPTCGMETPACPAFPTPRRAGPLPGLPRAPTAFTVAPPGTPRHPPPLSPRPGRCPPDKAENRYLGVTSAGPIAVAVHGKPFYPPGAAGTGGERRVEGRGGGYRGRQSPPGPFCFSSLLSTPARGPDPAAALGVRRDPPPRSPHVADTLRRGGSCRDAAPSEPGVLRRELAKVGPALPRVGRPGPCRGGDRGLRDRSRNRVRGETRPRCRDGGDQPGRAAPRAEKRRVPKGMEPISRGRRNGPVLRRRLERLVRPSPPVLGPHRAGPAAATGAPAARADPGSSGPGQRRQLPAKKVRPRGLQHSRFPRARPRGSSAPGNRPERPDRWVCRTRRSPGRSSGAPGSPGHSSRGLRTPLYTRGRTRRFPGALPIASTSRATPTTHLTSFLPVFTRTVPRAVYLPSFAFISEAKGSALAVMGTRWGPAKPPHSQLGGNR